MAGPGLICSKCYDDSTLGEWIIEATNKNPKKEWVCKKCMEKENAKIN